MGKVWIVTKGEYSDYRIEGVFSDEAKASRVAEMIQGDYDEYPLDDARVDAIPAGNKMHTVFLYRNQAPIVIESNPLLDESITRHTDHHGLGWYTVITWARDKDHALKVASDKAAEAQAKLLGLE